MKTDRRDAMMLAQTLRAGQLTFWVPDEAHEAMRDLVRLRAQAMRDLRKTRQQLPSFLLRLGLSSPYGHWTKMHRRWLGELTFAHPAQHLPIEEVLAPACPSPGVRPLPRQIDDRVEEPAVAGQAEEVIDARLAPGHQLLAGAAGVGAEQDPHLGPAPADAGDEARHRVLGAGRGVDVRAPELRRQQLPAEHVGRQITPAVVVAVAHRN